MKTLLAFTILLISSSVSAISLDSLIVECKIFDRQTKEPVVAKVRYESMPYGSKLGLRNDSTVDIRVDYDEKYTVRVQASGYQTQVFEIDFHKYAGAEHIIEEIALARGLEPGAKIVLRSLIFAASSAVITTESYNELDSLVGILNANPAMVIALEGHTDNVGDPKGNMKLSKERVEATRDYLVEKRIDKNRITIEAYGGTRPLSTDNTPQAHRENRRVEVRIVSN